jgi:hypothetical protein
MKRYIRANGESDILRKLGLSADEYALVKDWCDNTDADSEIGFEYQGQYITNPLLDTSARFEHTLADAVDMYGLDNIRYFCDRVLSTDAYANHICKVIDDGQYTTFFLTTDGEQGYWYWITDTSSVKNYRGTMYDFVNDDDNYNVGYSVAYFDTLEQAISDYEESN